MGANSLLRIQLDAIKLERQHIGISILVLEGLAEDFVQFVKFVLVAVQPI